MTAPGTYVPPPAGAGAGGQIAPPIAQITTPSLNLPNPQLQTTRGTCTLSGGGVGTLTFRTNPNSITWDYELITHIEQTYGGRVVQILGVKMDNLSVKVDCGQGGWPYAMYVVQFMRDLMVTQRNGTPATFSYTTRNWQLKVFALNVPFHDAVPETVRELELNFKIQQDVTAAATSQALSNALNSIQAGLGFYQSEFNQYSSGTGSAPNDASGGGLTSALGLSVSPTVTLPTALTGPPDTGIPGLDSISGLFGGLTGGFGGLLGGI